MPSTMNGCASPATLRGSPYMRARSWPAYSTAASMAASANALVSASVSVQRGPAREVAPGDAHHLAFALAAQRRHESGEVGLAGHRRREALRHLAARQRAR